MNISIFSARCNIYISRLCYDVSFRLSVRLFVTEVHWCIIGNLGFKFWSKFTAQPTMRPHALAGALWSRCMPGRGEGSSRAILDTARPSCYGNAKTTFYPRRAAALTGSAWNRIYFYWLEDAAINRIRVSLDYLWFLICIWTHVECGNIDIRCTLRRVNIALSHLISSKWTELNSGP